MAHFHRFHEPEHHGHGRTFEGTFRPSKPQHLRLKCQLLDFLLRENTYTYLVGIITKRTTVETAYSDHGYRSNQPLILNL